MNIKQALAKQAGFRRDAEALLLHCLGREERAWLIAHDTDELPEAVVTEFEQFCQQRRSGTPLAYLLGFREFWSLKLKVTPAGEGSLKLLCSGDAESDDRVVLKDKNGEMLVS